MPTLDPLALGAFAAGALGVVLLVQARTQSRMLRRRIAGGVGTVVVELSPPAVHVRSTPGEVQVASSAEKSLLRVRSSNGPPEPEVWRSLISALTTRIPGRNAEVSNPSSARWRP